MSTRRAFLGTLGKALGAGGVLLPWAGKGALALPANLGKAAALPVTPTPLPVSAEMLRLRETRRELHSIYLATPDDYPKQDRPDEFGSRDGRTKAWREVMRGKHTPTKRQIIGRKKPTWSDCVEIAEICLFDIHRHGPCGPYFRDNPMIALVHAVLSAGAVGQVIIPEIGDFSPPEPGELP